MEPPYIRKAVFAYDGNLFGGCAYVTLQILLEIVERVKEAEEDLDKCFVVCRW